MVARKATNRIVGPYRIPNVKIDCLAVYTNTVPASSYRGLGAAQVTFPGESQMDELAEMLRLRSGAVPAEESGESRRVDQSGGAADRCGCSGRHCAKWPRRLQMDKPLAPDTGARCAARRAMRARIR